MPNQTAITVKKNDGTTDVIYTGVVPSAGDKSPAKWRSPIGSAPAFKPELTVVAAPNGNGQVRRLVAEFSYPVTSTATDGKVSVTDKPKMRLEIPLPQGMDQAVLDEYVSQGLNLFASIHFRDQAKSGYAST